MNTPTTILRITVIRVCIYKGVCMGVKNYKILILHTDEAEQILDVMEYAHDKDGKLVAKLEKQIRGNMKIIQAILFISIAIGLSLTSLYFYITRPVSWSEYTDKDIKKEYCYPSNTCYRSHQNG